MTYVNDWNHTQCTRIVKAGNEEKDAVPQVEAKAIAFGVRRNEVVYVHSKCRASFVPPRNKALFLDGGRLVSKYLWLGESFPGDANSAFNVLTGFFFVAAVRRLDKPNCRVQY